jgi:type III secretory pathway component EscV
VVVEAFDAPTQKMQAFKQKLYLREIGIPIPTEDLLEDATFQNKSETIKKIQQNEAQQREMQMQQMQVQMQEMQARAELSHARANADQGLAVERASRVQENQALAVERRAEAIKDLESASLDKIRAAKELTTIDLSQLQQLLDIVERIRSGEENEIKSLEKPQTQDKE